MFKHGNGNEYQYKVTGNHSQNACFSDDFITKELDEIGLLKTIKNKTAKKNTRTKVC